MWANAQRDGRPAEYRWRRLFNAAVWLTPTTRLPCSNAATDAKPVISQVLTARRCRLADEAMDKVMFLQKRK